MRVATYAKSHRPHRAVRPGGVPPGVRRRARLAAGRLRADRRRRLRDAPDGGAARRRAALGARAARRSARPTAACAGVSDVPAVRRSAARVFDGERALERGRCAHAHSAAGAAADEGQARLPADRARAAGARRRCWPTRARRPHRGRGDRQRRGRAVLGLPAARGLEAGARAARRPRPLGADRSSSRAGVPWEADEHRHAHPARARTSRASGWRR